MKATQLLKKDHNSVKKLFTEFNRTTSRAVKKRRDLVEKLAMELEIHARVEEEIFYPAVRQIGEAQQLVDEAREEHQVVRELIQQLRRMEPADDQIKARVKALREAVLHHATEEEHEMFGHAEGLGNERLSELGREIEARKRELMDEQTGGRRGRRAA